MSEDPIELARMVIRDAHPNRRTYPEFQVVPLARAVLQLAEERDAAVQDYKRVQKLCDIESERVVKYRADRDALRGEVERLLALLPKCLGTWLKGSGGHRVYARDCADVGAWNVGVGYVCDKHRVPVGDDDAYAVDDECTERADDCEKVWTERQSLRSQLAACRSALREACDIATRVNQDAWPDDVARIATLRQIADGGE